jgi:PAS domain S-box-containing protein
VVHVEKFSVKGKTYYKLVHSVRKQGKVKGRSKYLGKELPAPEILEELKRKFYDEILTERMSQQVLQKEIVPTKTVSPVNVSKKNNLSKQKIETGTQSGFGASTLYKDLFEKALHPILIMDKEEIITDFNLAAQILTGFPADELFNLPFARLLEKDRVKEVTKMVERAIYDNKQEMVNFSIINKNQERINIEGNFHFITKKEQNYTVLYLNNISDVKKVQEKLKNITIFRYIADSLSEVLFYADPISLAPTYVSAGVKNMFGYNQEEWIGDPSLWHQKIYHEDRKKVLEVIEESRKNKTPVDVHTRMLNSENQILWVLLHIYLRSNTQGKVTSLIVLIEDITGRKERQDKYNILYNHSPVGMIEQDFLSVGLFLQNINLKTEEDIRKYFEKKPLELEEVRAMVKVTDVNKGVLNLFGAVSRESFIKIYEKKQFCRPSNEVFIKELAAIAQGKTEFETDLVIFSMDGRRKTVSLKWMVPNVYKDTYSKVLITLIDTGIQRELNEIIKVKNHAIESSPAGVILTDLEGRITYTNAAFLQLWNLGKVEELLGQKVEDYLPHKQGPMKVIQSVHQKKEWAGNLIIGKVKPRFVETHGTFIYDESNEPLALVFSFIDITELKKTEQIRLEFTNIAAHELKTPIVPLRTLLTMMLDDAEGFEIKKKAMNNLKVCLRNVNRLNVLIGDILDISRLEAGGMKFSLGEFNIVEVIKVVISDYRDFIKDKRLLLKSRIPTTVPRLYGDKLRISQVVGNLIKNAANFTDKGSIQIEVSLIKDFVQVDVIDTGAGISKIAQAKLFTKFFQEQDITVRKTKGTGLGLAISKGIIEHHGGTIWAFSEGKGKGSRFSFTLPLKAKIHQEMERKVEDEMLLGEKILLDKVSNKTARHYRNNKPTTKIIKKDPISHKEVTRNDRKNS